MFQTYIYYVKQSKHMCQPGLLCKVPKQTDINRDNNCSKDKYGSYLNVGHRRQSLHIQYINITTGFNSVLLWIKRLNSTKMNNTVLIKKESLLCGLLMCFCYEYKYSVSPLMIYWPDSIMRVMPMDQV